MTISELMRRMAELGAPMEAILLAVEAIETEQAKDAERRAKRAAQKAKERAKGATVARQSCDEEATVVATVAADPSPKERSPTPPKEITPPRSSLRSVSETREAFDRFWQAYPRRTGSNPRKPAADKFALKVKSGADPEAIIAGARAYAASVAQADPRYTAQAVTWLNQDRWQDDHRPVAAGRGAPQKQTPKSWFTIAREANGVADDFASDDQPFTVLDAEPVAAEGVGRAGGDVEQTRSGGAWSYDRGERRADAGAAGLPDWPEAGGRPRLVAVRG